jgi:glycosyltransferase involved in cell wall biosynthesis
VSNLKVLVLDQARGVWGAQRYLLRLAPLLRERGVELCLAGPQSLELHTVWSDAGFEAIHLDLPIDRSIRSSGRPSVARMAHEGRAALRTARDISDLACRGGYDAVWANAHWIHLDASIAGRFSRKPVVLHLHEEAMPGVGRWLRATAVRTATRAVAVSQAVASGLPGFLRARVDVIPNGVDAEAMSPASASDAVALRVLRHSFGIGDDEILAVAATRLDPSKRIEDLIAAVAAVADRRVRLVIAGSTSGYPDYERHVRSVALDAGADRIIFCGDRDDMPWLFRAADLVIHAGVVEGMPLGLIEAESCGKAVIAYDVAGVSEAVRHGETGLLVKPLDVKGLSDALELLAGSIEVRDEMGAAAREYVVSHHRIDVQAQHNAAVLNDVCGRSGSLAA